MRTDAWAWKGVGMRDNYKREKRKRAAVLGTGMRDEEREVSDDAGRRED